MKTRKNDIPYCGVDRGAIERAEPVLDTGALDLFMTYIKERYRIHIKKDVMYKKPPWTNDPILGKFRFTNIRREHDRETRWLIKYITGNDFLTYRQKLMNVILFRLFNKHESVIAAGGPFKFEAFWSYVPSRKRLLKYQEKNPDYVFFTNAFITSGMKTTIRSLFNDDFIPGCIMRYMKRINENGLMDRIRQCKTPAQVFNVLRAEQGIGEFLAYQIFVDYTYIKEFPFSENEFVVAGPGCKKGLNYLFLDRDRMTYEECLFWLRDNWEDLEDYADNWFDPEEEMADLKRYDRVMNVMSLENCFCEFSKYYRAIKGGGRPRNNYKKSKEE